MGNCCERCFGRLDKRKYLRTRYNVERDFSIEFENLMEDEPTHEELPNGRIISDQEKMLISGKNYGTLLEQQKKIDREIMEELVQQEEQLRMEEEAYYEAKREAARIARLQKMKEQNARQMSSSVALRNGPKAWLGDDESDWEVAGGDDDFEMFLESVKARSLAARTRALPSQVPVDAASETSSKDDRSRTEASSLDLEWEHEAGMQPPPRDRKRKFIATEENITELTVKPMLMLRNKQNESFDYEWDTGFEANNDSDIEECQKLLSQRKLSDSMVEADR